MRQSQDLNAVLSFSSLTGAHSGAVKLHTGKRRCQDSKLFGRVSQEAPRKQNNNVDCPSVGEGRYKFKGLNCKLLVLEIGFQVHKSCLKVLSVGSKGSQRWSLTRTPQDLKCCPVRCLCKIHCLP